MNISFSSFSIWASVLVCARSDAVGGGSHEAIRRCDLARARAVLLRITSASVVEGAGVGILW